MHKTLLLVFIHGFKGNDNTFGTFPEHLRATISHALPNISVRAVTYPKYETRGDLKECVSKFRDWLQNKVIDLEVAAQTPSPTVDPSVHVVLVGHSMGGIMAADTLISIATESPIASTKEPQPSSTTKASTTSTTAPNLPPINSKDKKPSRPSSRTSSRPSSPANFLFPHIQGVLAFDTPYLGISPGVVAHGAEAQYQSASSAYGAISEVASLFGWGANSSPNSKDGKTTPKSQPKGAMSAGPEAVAAIGDAAAVPVWQKWGKYAMFAGAAGAVAATGAAAYVNRDSITEGWSWTTSHLEFVGCLMRVEDLKQRVTEVVKISKNRSVGWADLYTQLGRGAGEPLIKVADSVSESKQRTFCSLPRKVEWKRFFEVAVNEKAKDEAWAHMNMFFPRENPGYYNLGERAKTLVVSWVDQGWYRSSESKRKKESALGKEENLGGEEPVMVD